MSESQIDYILRDPVRPGPKSKQRMTPISTGSKGIDRLMRIISKAPEAVVKISGTTTTSKSAMEHLNYITRNGKLDAENEKQDVVSGRKDVKQLHEEWGFTGKDFAPGVKGGRAKMIHIVLSMPAGTDRDAVGDAARAFAQREFGPNHQYLMAQHDDTEHPHLHIAVRAQGYDMRWVKRSKADLQAWRQMFAEELRARGVVAEASPRRARGVVKKADSQVVRRLRNTPEKSKVLIAKVRDAITEVRTGTRAAEPWKKKIEARQADVRSAYGELARAAKATPGAGDMAKKIEAWIASMPQVRTERDVLRDRATDLSRGAAKDRGGPEL